MSRWSNDLDNHPIHELLARSIELLETEVEGFDRDFEEERRRLRKVVAELRGIILGLDGEFYPISLLNDLNNYLRHQNFLEQLKQYADSPAIIFLEVANDHITAYAPQIFHLSGMSRPVESAAVIAQAEKAFGSFSKSVERQAKDFRDSVESNSKKLETLDSRTTELLQQLRELNTTANSKFSEWQQEFTANQVARAEEHSTSQIERDSEHKEELAKWKRLLEKRTTAITQTHDESLKSISEEFQSTAETILADITSKHESVLEIHNLVGRDSVAGGYQKSAGEEGKAADRWRLISMAGLSGAIVWSLLKYSKGFDQLADGGQNWAEIITATSITAILLGAAGFAAAQSKMHRGNEKQLRSYALETKALDPFIASLEKDQQQEIKKELVRRMFGQQHADSAGQSEFNDEKSALQLAEKISDAVKEKILKLPKDS